MLFLFICANIPKITRYKYLIKTKSYNIGFESKIINSNQQLNCCDL